MINMTWTWEKENLSPQQELNQWSPECPSGVQEVMGSIPDWDSDFLSHACVMLINSSFTWQNIIYRLLHVEPDIVFIHEFLYHIANEEVFRASEQYSIKNKWIKMIGLLTCNNCLLHVTCYVLGGFSCHVLVFILFEKLRNIFIGDIHKSW